MHWERGIWQEALRRTWLVGGSHVTKRDDWHGRAFSIEKRVLALGDVKASFELLSGLDDGFWGVAESVCTIIMSLRIFHVYRGMGHQVGYLWRLLLYSCTLGLQSISFLTL